MNPIQFECPHCHEIIVGDESQYGQRVTCGKCQAAILVPLAPAGAGLKTARLISGETVRTHVGTTETVEETEIFRLSPVARAFFGQILLALIFLGLAVGLKFFAQEYTWSTWAALGSLGIGLLLLLLVWSRVKSSNYRLTTQRLFIRRGWLAKHVEEMELYRVKDVRVNQSFLQRLLGYGTITVLADDDTTPQMELAGIASPTEIKEQIRTHYRTARQREGVRPTEFMNSP